MKTKHESERQGASRACRTSLCVLAAALASTLAEAAPNSFTNTAGGSWETAGNWSSGFAPTNTDAIFITNMATYTVFITNSTADTDPGVGGWMTISNLNVGASNNLASLVIDFTNAAKILTVGIGNTVGTTVVGDQIAQRGALTMSNGALSTATLILGQNARSQGTLNLAGGTITLRSPSGLTLAANNVASTGVVVMTGGQLIITNGSTATTIGNLGRGVFTLSNGLFLSKNLSVGNRFVTSELNLFGGTNISIGAGVSGGGDALRVAIFSDGRGQVLIDGGTLIITNGNTRIGHLGHGTVIQSNGTFVAETVVVGTSITANVRGEWNIIGAGSASTVKGPMWIGGTALSPGGTGIVSVVGSPTLDWRSNITVQTGGRLSFSNYVGNIGNGGVVTNLGRIVVMNSQVRYGKAVVIGGSYVSDPSTNMFSSNVTVTASGFLQGGAGDLFQFERNFANASTNLGQFDLLSASVLFTNGSGQHVFDLTGSLALDNGTGYSGIADVQSNFALGSLSISALDTFLLAGGTTNALYVGALDFGGLGNTNNLTLNINLYYDASLAQNAYLGGLTYDLDGAGQLIPFAVVIPEPGSFALCAIGVALFLLGWGRRNQVSTKR